MGCIHELSLIFLSSHKGGPGAIIYQIGKRVGRGVSIGVAGGIHGRRFSSGARR